MRRIQLSKYKNKDLIGKWFQFDFTTAYYIKDISNGRIYINKSWYTNRVVDGEWFFTIIPGHKTWDYITVYTDLDELKVGLL